MKNLPQTPIEIIKAWKASPDLQAKYGNLATFETVCNWQNDPKLRAEFGTFETFDAYVRAKAAGKVKSH